MDTAWVLCSGTGMICAYSTLRRAVLALYTLACVGLDERVSMMTNFIDCDTDAMKVGDRVRFTFNAAEDGTLVPTFVPCEAASCQ